jgi:hypothetical protein
MTTGNTAGWSRGSPIDPRWRLVRLSGLAIEVEEKLVVWCEASGPVAGNGHALVPDVPAEEAPILVGHPGQPLVPVADHSAVAMHEAEVDQHLCRTGHHKQGSGEDALHQSIPVGDVV